MAGERLLLVDDEDNLRSMLEAALRHNGFEVSAVANGRDALDAVAKDPPDLIVLDVMLPDIDGFEVCRRIRTEGSHAPVLFLTARDATEDKVRGLTLGGDDYLVKPFSLEELVARAHAVLRRSGLTRQDGTLLACADLTLDDDAHRVTRAGAEVSLSPTEYNLLRYLLVNQGRVLSKAQILDHVWQYDFGGDGGSEGSDLRYRVRAYVEDREGFVTVLALPIDSVDNAVAGLITVEALGVAAIGVVLGFVAWWVIHLGVRPVKPMTSVATAIAGGDLSHRLPAADPHTEAGELGAALNQMLGRIEAAFDERSRAEGRLRQFVADASHELRTPVGTIWGYAELFRSGGLEERAQLADAMRRTEQEAVRMGSLVDDLLHLARLDQGRPLEAEPVDVAHLAEDAARDAGAVDPGRPVAAVVDGPVVISGDESRLRQVIANVARNTLVHTPPETPIEIRAWREDGSAIIAITDHGPGMSEDVAARAFERFFRADPARSRHRGGSGLGLSIVEATVAAHGGTTVLRTAPGQGTTVRIALPLDRGS